MRYFFHSIPHIDIRTYCLCIGVFFCFVLVTPLRADAADIESRSVLPNTDAEFYDGDTINFYGESVNVGGGTIVEGGWADVEIEWNYALPSIVSQNVNAFAGSMLGGFVGGQVKPLQKELIAPPGGHPTGEHRYRFNSDTTNQLAETNEANNRSAWRYFSVSETPFAPIITLTASQNPITAGESTNLEWNVQNADTCTFEPAGWNNAEALNGTEAVSPLVTTLYSIDCVGSGGNASKEFTVDVTMAPPSITFGASANPIDAGESTDLEWTVVGADTCTASGGWLGLKNASGATEIVSPLTTTTYTLTCDGDGGTTVKSQIVNVNIPVPVITFTATPTSIPNGGSSLLQWSVVGATSCYSNSSGFNSPTSKNPVSGSHSVSPTTNTTYTLSCGNSSGTSTLSRTVTVTGIPDLTIPVTFAGQQITTATGTTVQEGQTTIFKGRVRNSGTAGTLIGFTDRFRYAWGWPNYNNFSWVDRPALGAGQSHDPYDESAPFLFDRSGLLEVEFCGDQAITLPTSRIVESSDSNNCAWRTFSVPGLPGAPTLTMTLSPDMYLNSSAYALSRPLVGATTTITWSTTGATSCTGTDDSAATIDNGWSIGTKPTSGSYDVNPTATSSYSLSCTGPGGTVVKSVRVNLTVRPPQILSFTASQNPVPRGGTVQLSWTATSSASCTASGGWSGTKNRLGGTETTSSINAQTIYTLTCTTPGTLGGTVIRNITVDVYDPPPDITLGIQSGESNPITPLDTTALAWNVIGATSCTASGGGAPWDGARDPTSGNVTVEPNTSTTYTLSCTGPGGSASKSLTVTVVEAAPIVSFSVPQNTIIEGNPANLEWNVLGATACTPTTDPNDPSSAWNLVPSASLIASGGDSLTISPDITRKYILDCSGPWGQTIRDLTVYVIPEAVIDTFELCTVGPDPECRNPSNTSDINPWTINPGTPLEIQWEANEDTATFCSQVEGNGFYTDSEMSGTDAVSATPYPDTADEYTVACGSAGLLTGFATIYLRTNPVSPEISISPRILPPGGGELTVSWDTNNGDQSICSLTGGGLSGLLPVTGSDVGETTLSIYGRTTFTLTCGSEADSVTVELSPTMYET